MHELPDERHLRIHIIMALFGERELPRQSMFQLGVRLSLVRMRAKKLAEQECELLGEGTRTPDVDVGAALTHSLPKVALRPFGVVRAIDKPCPFDRHPNCVEWFERGDRNLDVDDRLGVETSDGC